MERIIIPEHQRFVPLIPCPWRHDASIKPPSCKRIFVVKELEWMQEKWNIAELHKVNQHILYDMDSWYLIGCGLMDITEHEKAAIRAEQAIQKMHSSTPLLVEEVQDIVSIYNIDGNPDRALLASRIKMIEDLKCWPVGPTFLDGFYADPFHTRMSAPASKQLKSVIVSPTQFPNVYTQQEAEGRKYDSLDTLVFDILKRGIAFLQDPDYQEECRISYLLQSSPLATSNVQ